MTVDALEAQLETLRAERAKATEPVVQEALDAKIAALEGERADVALKQAAAVREEVVPPRELMAEERREYDAGIGRVRLFVNRSEWSSVEKEIAVLRQTFGDHAELLEAQGDVYRERKKFEAAKEMYAKALKLRPNDVGIGRKHGEAAFHAGNLGSLDDQMRANLGGGSIVDADPMARAGVATLLSFFIPGAGQFVLGEQVKGISIFVVWLLAMGYAVLHPGQFHGLLSQLGMARGGEDPGGLLWLSLVVVLVCVVVAVFDCAAKSKSTPKDPPTRPKPPVDLPFE